MKQNESLTNTVKENYSSRTIRQALSVSENSATLDPYGYDDGLERAYMVES